LKVALVGGVILVAGLAVVHAGQRASPHESVSATVDGSDLTITYGRPFMRGRTVFGRLVPYGRVWCPGADEATTLESTKPLRFGSLTVPAGPHTIWMLPTADAWTLIVSKEPSGFHTRYNPDADLGRVPLEKRVTAGTIEQLTFRIGHDGSAPDPAIAMLWASTVVLAPFRVVE
jgi:hypothetical protein